MSLLERYEKTLVTKSNPLQESFSYLVKYEKGRMDLLNKLHAHKKDNWQDVSTPLDICKEMVDLIEDKDCGLAVLFSLEFLEVMIFKKKMDPTKIVFFGDNLVENSMAKSVYGVKTGILSKALIIKDGVFSKDAFIGILKGSDMKFEKLAVIMNPPYQEEDGGSGRSAGPLYHKFVEAVIDKLNPSHLVGITPSRWMLGGKGLDTYRNRMMKDKHIKTIVDDISPSGIFTTVDIAGGVSYFHWDKNHNGFCNFNGVIRDLNEFPQDIIVRETESIQVLHKVLAAHSGSYIGSIASARKPYGFDADAQQKSSGTPCWFKQSIGLSFVDPAIVKDTRGDLNKWKVIAPRVVAGAHANISKSSPIFLSTSILVISPGEVCSETYLVINSFKTKNEANNFQSYFSTKFFRFMLRIRLTSQDAPRGRYDWVPDMGNYTITYTDADLYKMFNLTRKEIAFIESKIR